MFYIRKHLANHRQVYNMNWIMQTSHVTLATITEFMGGVIINAAKVIRNAGNRCVCTGSRSLLHRINFFLPFLSQPSNNQSIYSIIQHLQLTWMVRVNPHILEENMQTAQKKTHEHGYTKQVTVEIHFRISNTFLYTGTNPQHLYTHILVNTL